jgi:hypothetical protein
MLVWKSVESGDVLKYTGLKMGRSNTSRKTFFIVEVFKLHTRLVGKILDHNIKLNGFDSANAVFVELQKNKHVRVFERWFAHKTQTNMLRWTNVERLPSEQAEHLRLLDRL